MQWNKPTAMRSNGSGSRCASNMRNRNGFMAKVTWVMSLHIKEAGVLLRQPLLQYVISNFRIGLRVSCRQRGWA